MTVTFQSKKHLIKRNNNNKNFTIVIIFMKIYIKQIKDGHKGYFFIMNYIFQNDDPHDKCRKLNK